jgi:ADP-heptose:LPS heptosyltransferase
MTGTLIVLRALGLGDLLTAVPALRGLRRAYPRHRIVLCTPAPLAPIVFAIGAVDELCDTTELAPIDPSLAGADIAVNMHGRGPESHELVAELGPHRVVAFAHPDVAWSWSGPAWLAQEHEVHRWCRLVRSADARADPGDLHLELDVARRTALTVVHPGAASRSRRWPAERFAAVARAEVRRGRSVVITGGRDERALALDVAAKAGIGSGHVAAGRTSLGHLAALIAGAGRVVCGDTGVAHLATALQTPSVVLFGPVSPSLWGPPPDDRRHTVLWRGSTGDPHGTTTDAGLMGIGAEEVIDALDALPAR